MLRERVRAAVIAVAVLVGLTRGRAAHAFCRTTTCEHCVQPIQECVTEGIPIYWPVGCVSYDLQRDASDSADLKTATEVADLAFRQWANVSCPASGRPPSLKLENAGPVTCKNHEYNDQQNTFGGNANIIVFRDDSWTATNDPHTLALTTVTYNKNTGEIYDADIEINSHIQSAGMNGISTSTPIPDNVFDLQSILTHEAGHFLGLAHSDQPCRSAAGDCPTMDAMYTAGSGDFRDLEPDDVDGICAIYPSDRMVADTSCAPRHGFSGECGAPGHKGCCSTAPGAASSRGGQGLLAILAGLGVWAARGRRDTA